MSMCTMTTQLRTSWVARLAKVKELEGVQLTNRRKPNDRVNTYTGIRRVGNGKDAPNVAWRSGTQVGAVPTRGVNWNRRCGRIWAAVYHDRAAGKG